MEMKAEKWICKRCLMNENERQKPMEKMCIVLFGMVNSFAFPQIHSR